MSVLTLSVNSQSNKCFSDVEIDSIYSKLVAGKYAIQENIVLKEVLILSNQKNVEQEMQINILKTNAKNYGLLNENYVKMQENLYRIIDDKEAALKSEKRKKWNYLIKGTAIGFGVCGVGTVLFLIK